MTILAQHAWRTNAHLIADVAELYLDKTMFTLDPTYGRGNWWTVWRPDMVVCHDKYTLDGVDFRELPEADNTFDLVVFDPPYKLNGMPALGDFDARYGVDDLTRWQDRMQRILDGLHEVGRVLKPGGWALVKCQDQVVSGKVVWQTYEIQKHVGWTWGTLIDRFDLLGGGRRQPPGRRQVHARGRGSTLLVFRKVV